MTIAPVCSSDVMGVFSFHFYRASDVGRNDCIPKLTGWWERGSWSPEFLAELSPGGQVIRAMWQCIFGARFSTAIKAARRVRTA